jgi:hypothetical protein
MIKWFVGEVWFVVCGARRPGGRSLDQAAIAAVCAERSEHIGADSAAPPALSGPGACPENYH